MSTSPVSEFELTIPELGSSLGRIVVPLQCVERWGPLDSVREDLLERVLGWWTEARRQTLLGDWQQAVRTLGPRAWTAAWADAVRSAAEEVTARVDAELEGVAWQVHMGRRRRKKLGLTMGERTGIEARLERGGKPLHLALGELDTTSRALLASSDDDGAQHRWHESLLRVARRLEAAWLTLEEAVAAEHVRWEREREALLQWRPSLWPALALWVPFAALLMWFALVLGGYLPAPSWLASWLGW